MNWPVRISAAFLLAITLLPLLPSGRWYIRWWDFPRLQVCFLLALLLSYFGWYLLRAGSWNFESGFWLLSLVAAMIWQGSHILPFSPIWQTEVADAKANAPTFKVLVSNLEFENFRNAEQVVDELREERADVLLLIEVNQQWMESLQGLRGQFRWHHDEVKEDGLGICLWSNMPIADAETRFIISSRRASIWATLRSDQGQNINFIGVHPTPPGLLDETGDSRRDSRVRDAELVTVAREIAERRRESWIVAGDFNDVAWSHTTRLFKRISGLKDPRIGRSFMGTFIAQCPPCRCPIDHVFVSQGFEIAKLARKRISGSDHFAVIVKLHLTQEDAGTNPATKGDDAKDARQMVEQGKQDARERGVKTDSTPQ